MKWVFCFKSNWDQVLEVYEFVVSGWMVTKRAIICYCESDCLNVECNQMDVIGFVEVIVSLLFFC